MDVHIHAPGTRCDALTVRRQMAGASAVLSFALILCACSNVEPPRPSPLTLDDVEHELPAFEGVLLGASRGEFVGYLAHCDHGGNVTSLLRENVHGIVENEAGIFVLTGLSHLGISKGNLYQVRRGPDGVAVPILLGHLPGAPSHVVQEEEDGRIHFLIEIPHDSGRSLLQCHTLQGAAVSYSNSCDAPTS